MRRVKLEIEGLVVEINQPTPAQHAEAKKKVMLKFKSFQALQSFLQRVENGQIETYVGISQKIESAWEEVTNMLQAIYDLVYNEFKRLNGTMNETAWNRESFDKAFDVNDVQSAQRLFNLFTEYVKLDLIEEEAKN